MITIYYWPDGTWCYSDEYARGDYGFKSDDFGKLTVSGEMSDAEINRMVDEAVS